MRRVAIGVLFFACVIEVSAAQRWNSKPGWEEYGDGDLDAAVRIWAPLAQQGDGSAQLGMSRLYSSERVYKNKSKNWPKKNPDEQARWLRAAAESGNGMAMAELSNLYEDSTWAQSSLAEAFEWDIKALDAGYELAGFSLGTKYSKKGIDVPAPYLDVVKEVTQRSEADAKAMYVLGLMYGNGSGVPEDQSKSLALLERSATRNFGPAQWSLCSTYDVGFRVQRDEAAADKWCRMGAANGNENCRSWMVRKAEKAIEQKRYGEALEILTTYGMDDARGLKVQADLHLQGLGVKVNPARAAELMLQSSEMGFGEAQRALGAMYRDGKGVQVDLDRSIYWIEQAIKSSSDPINLTDLGMTLYEVKGPKRDIKRVLELLTKGSTAGDHRASAMLAHIYLKGDGVPVDVSKGRELLGKAVSEGNTWALWRLGELYYRGAGPIKSDRKQALQWYQQAAVAGDEEAMRMVELLSTPQSNVATRDTEGPYPPRPSAQPGRTVCATRCTNADCYRTYADGRQVHFQAQQKFNPLNNQFEFDSGGC